MQSIKDFCVILLIFVIIENSQGKIELEWEKTDHLQLISEKAYLVDLRKLDNDDLVLSCKFSNASTPNFKYSGYLDTYSEEVN